MPQASVGNDIVDLDVPAEHPRFKQKILSAREVERLNDTINIWLFWAAKEAAFKAIKRISPTVTFKPKEFELDPQHMCISYEGYKLSCKWEITPDYVYLFCVTNNLDLQSPNIFNWIDMRTNNCRENDSPSVAVRKLVKERLSSELKLDLAGIEIEQSEDNVPYLLINGERAKHLLSFSHHGRYVAATCAIQK